MEFPIKLHAIKSGWSIVCIEGSQFIISKEILYFFPLKIHFVIANSADPDKNAALCDISSGSSLFAKVPV